MADKITAEERALFDVMEDQVARQGVGVITGKDGTTMMFTTAILERLLARSLESGKDRVIIFVKHTLGN